MGATETCYKCCGTGRDFGTELWANPCVICNGRGTVVKHSDVCLKCHGRGYL
jgi:DnaJ-class molecular chaperone